MTTSNPYKEYLLKKYGYDGAIEEGGSFLLYKHFNEHELVIGELFVPEEDRLKGVATKLADQATVIAKESGKKFLVCNTVISGDPKTEDAVSMMAILSYGFFPVRAQSGQVQFAKEIK